MDVTNIPQQNSGIGQAAGLAAADPYMAIAQLTIDGVGEMKDAIRADYSQGFGPENLTGYTDINSIRNAEYGPEKPSFFKVGPTTIHQLANNVRFAKYKKAEAQFQQDKQKRLRTVLNRNAAFRNRDRYMSNLGQSSASQVDRFLSQIS